MDNKLKSAGPSNSVAFRFGIETVGADYIVAPKHPRDKPPSDLNVAGFRKSVSQVRKNKIAHRISQLKRKREFL